MSRFQIYYSCQRGSFTKIIQIVSNRQQFRQQTTAPASQSKHTQEGWEKARPFSELPGPSAFQMIRNHIPGGKYYKKGTDKMFRMLKEEYGDILVLPALLGRPLIVMTSDSNNVESVFRNEGVWPHRIGIDTLSYHRTKLRADFFNGVQGLVTSQGEAWGDFRTKVNPVMLQSKNVRLYLQKMSDVSNEFMQIMRKEKDSETSELPENFESYINRWAMESICVVALDKQLGLLKDNTLNPMIAKLFDCLTDFLTFCHELENKPSLWKFMTTPGYKRLMRAYDGILEVTSHYVLKTMQELEEQQRKGIEKPEHEKSVLEKLLKIDKKVAIVMAMDMLMAGIDTTTSTFAAIMLCLAKNPDKQAKLREELFRILPQKDSKLTEKSLKDMPYLHACIKESMRMHPLIDGNVRKIARDIVLSGYQIPKGTFVAMILSELNRDAKYFLQPNDFIPERWLRLPKEDDAGNLANALKSSHPFVFLPFGFGPRSCIGRRFAQMELEIGVAYVIRNFDVAFHYPTENAFKTLLMNVPNIPLKFHLTDIES